MILQCRIDQRMLGMTSGNDRKPATAAPVDALVGRRLREKREATGRSLAEVAEELGVMPEELAAIENGRVGLPARHLLRAAQFFGVDVDWFFRVPDKGQALRSEERGHGAVELFLALPESPEMMQAFLAIDGAERRRSVVTYAWEMSRLPESGLH
jgi:transcriptional regulator with XRE-family HTH domain